MEVLLWGLGFVVLWLLWALATHFASTAPRGDVVTFLATLCTKAYVRVVHNLRVEGLEHVPATHQPGKLVVVANHTAGVDPLLVQAACPFFIRWMMARDMRLPAMELFWQWAEIISVDRSQREISGARTAIRHLEDGGVIGIFPEGMLARPPQQIMPFVAGVGLIVHRAQAPVLPVIIDGTPQVDPAWSSLWRTSRSTIRFMPIIEYDFSEMRPTAIAADLRQRFHAATQWPLNDSPPIEFPGGKGKGSRVVSMRAAQRHAV